MKRFICSVLAATMLFSSSVFADTTANVYLGDRLVSYTDQAPVIINDRTYVPIRDVFETAGFKVDWKAENKTVTISNDYHNIMLFTETNGLFSMDTEFNVNYDTLENPVQIVNGRTLLPLREILESADYSLEWDAETKSAKVTDNNDYAELDAQLEKLRQMESLLNKKEEVFDKTKPAGELSEEEYAFLDNMYTVFDDMSNAAKAASLGDVSELSPENVKMVSKLIDGYMAKLSDVECPESLKGLDTGLQKVMHNMVLNVAEIAEATSANPDNSDLAFMTVFGLMAGLAVQYEDAVQPLTDLCKEKNIDIKAVFGEKYNTDLFGSVS